MKKRVRIYKSQNGEGQFLNKTAQFLRKAQMGGVPNIEDISYPGNNQAQQQVTNDQLVSLVMSDISNSRPKEEIVGKLVNVYGKDPIEAATLVDQIYQYLQEQSEAQKEEDAEEEQDSEDTDQYAEQNNLVSADLEDSDVDGFYGDDLNNDAANQIVNEDNEDDYDDTDNSSDLIMQRGGFMMRADEGLQVQNQYPIVFPGASSYLPADMINVMSEDYYSNTGDVWQRPEFQSFNNIEDSEDGIALEENYDQSEFMKGGAYKKSKKEYVNSVLKLVKKQMGGNQETDDSNDLTNKSNQADPIGAGLRKNILQNYIGTLKAQGNLAVAKEQAEKEYDQMMQQQMMMQNQDYPLENESLEEAQFGGFFRRRKQMNGLPNERRGLFNREPKLPKGFNYAYPPIESIDVRRSGIFGRPKEYSINFGQYSVMPGMTPGFYGYGQTVSKKTPARKIVEDQAVYVNSQANEEVAAVTPGNEATNKETVQGEEQGSVVTQGTENVEKQTVNVPAKSKTQKASVKKPAITKETDKSIAVKKPDYSSFQKATGEMYKNDLEHYAKTVKVNGKDVIKKWTYNPRTKEWFRENSNTPLKNSKSLDQLNSWRHNFNLNASGQTKSNNSFDKKLRSANEELATFKHKPSKPITGLDPSNPNDLAGQMALLLLAGSKIKPSQFTLKPMPKGYLPGSKGLPSPQKRISGPNSSGKTPKQLPYSGSDVIYTPPGGFQKGGIIDYNSGLYKFIYGGNEDPSLSYIDQSDIDYLNSKDISDAYFQNGGGTTQEGIWNPITSKDEYNRRLAEERKKWEEEYSKTQSKNNTQQTVGQIYPNYYQGYPMFPNMVPSGNYFNTFFPANFNRPSYSTNYLGARNSAGQTIPGNLGQNAYLKSIDVHKRGWLTGRPKKYSITFGHSSADSKEHPLITLPEQDKKEPITNTFSNSQNQLSSREIAKGERQAGRQRPLFTPRKYETYFEQYELTPEEKQKADEKEKKYQDDAAAYYKQEQDAANLVGKFFNRQPEAKMTQNEIQNFGQMTGNVSGLPSYRQYGGDLRKFIPQALYGSETPVIYTNNPAMDGVSVGDLVSMDPGIQGLQGSIDWSVVAPQGNLDASYKGPQPEQIEVAPESYQIPQTYRPEGDVTYDFKTKAQFDNATIQGALQTGNAAVKGGLGMLDRLKNLKREKEMYNNLTSDNLYATDPSRDRGDYDTNSGLYRPNEMGQTWNSRSKQFGGENEYPNEDPDYVDGDEVYMTEEQIQDFLARGGELEYL